MTDVIEITNDGPLLTGTNYWATENARRGLCFLSINAGAFRLLVPEPMEATIADMTTATEILISRGPAPAQRCPDALELLFEDHTDTPYHLIIDARQCDRLPVDTDAGKERVCVVYTRGPQGQPVERLRRPAWYRRAPRLPWLKARTH